MKKKNTVSWIFSVFRRFLPRIILVSLISSAVSVCGVVLILFTRAILDAAQLGRLGNGFYRNVIILAALLIFQIAASLAGSLLRTQTLSLMDMTLKKRMFDSLIKKDYSAVSAMHSGELVTRFSSDIDIVVQGFGSIIPNAVSLITKLTVGLAVVIMLEPLVAVLVLAIGFGLPLVGRLMNKKYKILHKEAQRTDGVVRSFLQESIQNMVVIKSFVADAPIKDRLDGYLLDNHRVKVKRGIISTLMHSAINSSFTLAYYGVIIWGAIGIANQSLTYGTFLAFLQLVSQLRNPLQSVSALLPQYYSMTASAERLIEIESIADDVQKDRSNFAEFYKGLRSISAKGLCFAYDEQYVIKNCEFSITKGSVCAVMGESGTGKSTLFRLLLALHKPSAGDLFFDTDSGQIPLSSAHRGLFAYVPQGGMILSGTIRENIAFLSSDATDEQIEHAAKQAVIYDFISSLPDGFNTKIGERGLGLSEGQIQRIAIARALLLDSPVLLLDECTSALDLETERTLLTNLKAEKDKTVVLITHRHAALEICDHVLYVDGGKVSEKEIH